MGIVLLILAAVSCALNASLVYSGCYDLPVSVSSENSNEAQLLIGEDFTMTCTGDKKVPDNCAEACAPRHGLAMWYCRQNDKWDQCQHFPSGPNPPNVLKYDHTEDDSATKMEMSYTITNGSERDSDTYHCFAGSRDQCFTRQENKSMKVSFKEKQIPQTPNISCTHHSCMNLNNQIHITVGGTVNLSCHGEGYPTPNYTWIHMPGGKTYDGQLLILSDINKTDGGHYECLVNNLAGSAYNTVKINVQDGPWPWWYYTIIASAVILLLIVIIIILIIHKIRRKEESKETKDGSYEQLCSSSESDDRSLVCNANHSTIVLANNVQMNLNSHINSCFIFHHSSDKSHAMEIKQRLESHNMAMQVTLWVEPTCRHTCIVRSLSQALNYHKHVIVVKTDNFIEKSQATLTEAFEGCNEEEKSSILSNMYVVSYNNKELLPMFQYGPTVMERSVASFCEDFLHKITDLRVVKTAGQLNIPGLQRSSQDSHVQLNDTSIEPQALPTSLQSSDGHVHGSAAVETQALQISSQNVDVHSQTAENEQGNAGTLGSGSTTQEGNMQSGIYPGIDLKITGDENKVVVDTPDGNSTSQEGNIQSGPGIPGIDLNITGHQNKVVVGGSHNTINF